MTVTGAEVPPGTVPSAALISWLLTNGVRPWEDVAESRVTCPGRVSVRITLWASRIPTFRTVMGIDHRAPNGDGIGGRIDRDLEVGHGTGRHAGENSEVFPRSVGRGRRDVGARPKLGGQGRASKAALATGIGACLEICRPGLAPPRNRMGRAWGLENT